MLSEHERTEIFASLEKYFSKKELKDLNNVFHQLEDIHVNVMLIMCRYLQTYQGHTLLHALSTFIEKLHTSQINLYLLLHHTFENPFIFRCLNTELSKLSCNQLETLLTCVEKKFKEDVPLLKLLRLSFKNIAQTKAQ